MQGAGDEWTLQCLQESQLGLHSVFETSVEKWAMGKYCFCPWAKRESTTQAEEEAAYISTSATHTFKGRGVLPESLSFPAPLFYVSPHDVPKSQSFPRRMCVCVSVLVRVLAKCNYMNTYDKLLFWALPSLLHLHICSSRWGSVLINADSLSVSK